LFPSSFLFLSPIKVPETSFKMLLRSIKVSPKNLLLAFAMLAYALQVIGEEFGHFVLLGLLPTFFSFFVFSRVDDNLPVSIIPVTISFNLRQSRLWEVAVQDSN
jgi:hypothetical protein